MKKKLELSWIGKERRHKLEPRILLEDRGLSYAARERVTAGDRFDNWIIKGDNLLALKALEQDFANQVKCVYIDPPYNTGSAFAHYDDGVEHSLWLSLMRDRLELLRRLLAEDGSIWITLDDNEAHYCKVLCDEIFGRANFVSTVIWEKSDSPRMDATFFSARHDYILVYAKDKNLMTLNKEFNDEVPAHYNRTDNAGRLYYTKPLRVMGGNISESLYFAMIAPDGTEVFPVETDGSKGCWRWSKRKVEEEGDRIDWVNGRNGWNPYFRIYAENRRATPTETIWKHEEVGSNRTSKNEIRALFSSNNTFDTPKPEKLLKRIIYLATNPGDLVLDSFAGSGTTGAVAMKMRRRWIMVELGDHAETHIVPRLQKVVDGADAGGVTAATNWTGGGGFRFFRLAPSLIVKDKYGMEIINKDYNPAMLAEAVCKLMNFRYQPSETVYWQMGQSTETDFIYVTTQTLTHAQLANLSEEVGDNRTLLVACAAFRANTDEFPNLTIRKIPQAVLKSCEFGKDDYSLKIAQLPQRQEDVEPRNTRNMLKKESKENTGKVENNGTPKLF